MQSQSFVSKRWSSCGNQQYTIFIFLTSHYFFYIMSNNNLKAYWKENLRYLSVLLAIWFLSGYIIPIFMYDVLPRAFVFWFAQQGSIYIFVILIFVYVRLMNKLDKKYNLDE